MAKSLRRGKSLDQIHMGNEPDFTTSMPSTEVERQRVLVSTLQWYGYMTDVKANQKYLVQYISDTKPFGKQNTRALSIAKNMTLSEGRDSTALKLIRMSHRGWELNEAELAWIDQLFDQIREKLAQKQKRASTPTKRISPAERMADRANETVMSDLEVMLDQWSKTTKPEPLELYKLIDQNGLGGPVPLKMIRQWLEANITELEGTKTDEQLKEGYSHVSAIVRNRRIKALKAMLADVDAKKTSQINKRRKPTRRKKTGKTMDKVLAKFNYKKEDPNLKLTSVDPSKVIGSQRVYVFNTRNNELHEYVAQSPDGIQIKGSSLTNFDKDGATKQRVKPEFIAQNVLKKTPRQVGLARKKLASKVSAATGRIGKDMLIVKVANK